MNTIEKSLIAAKANRTATIKQMIINLFNRIMSPIKAHNELNRARNSLNSMTYYELKDIGITRNEIESKIKPKKEKIKHTVFIFERFIDDFYDSITRAYSLR